MSLTPASSIAPSTVTVVGPLAVTGPLTDAELRASALPISDGGGSLTVDGAVDVNNFPATQPVSGPLTDAELRAAAVAVDGSAVTQPVAAESLPLPDGAASEATLNRARRSLDQVALATILAEDVV